MNFFEHYFLLPQGPLIAEARFGQFSTGFLPVFYQFSTWGLGPGASLEAVFFQFSMVDWTWKKTRIGGIKLDKTESAYDRSETPTYSDMNIHI